MIKEFKDDNNLRLFLSKTDNYIIVDLYASWCQPCLSLLANLFELTTDNELPTNVEVVKANIDHIPNFVIEQGVRGVPTLLVFKNGRCIDRKTGFQKKKELKEWVAEFTTVKEYT